MEARDPVPLPASKKFKPFSPREKGRYVEKNVKLPSLFRKV
jgi:hypothetical protein